MKMEREFNGVWIPAEIWLDKRLTICEKAFLAEVDSFTGNDRTFYKTNETIQEEYGIAPRTVQRMVKKLVSLGLLESSFNGRVRHLSLGRLAKLTGQGRQNGRGRFGPGFACRHGFHNAAHGSPGHRAS